jgi:hypothetical protein
MPTQETSEYAELSSQAYHLVADQISSTNGRTLEYWKSVWQIASAPYASSATEAAYRENFDRMNQIVGMTVNESSASSRGAVDFTEKIVALSSKFADLYVSAMRGVVNNGISNLTFVKDTAERQIGDMQKRLEEFQTTATSVASHN